MNVNAEDIAKITRTRSFGTYLNKVVTKPLNMLNAHAHHVVMKGKFLSWNATSLGRRALKALDKSREILRKHGIDPVYGLENLHWAPNRGHTRQYAIDVFEQLNKTIKGGGGYDEIVEVLEQIAKGM